jgi:hypothetical protein
MARRHLLATSALIASALAVCAPAQAATFFTGNGSSSIVNGTGSFYDSAIPEGMFTDIIEYTVPSAGAADVNVIYFKILSGITNISATFNGEALTFDPLGGNTFAAALSAPVLPGTQKITVSGNSGGLGSYSGNVTFAAVPELATWLMMIGGVGFTGFALRRRKTAYNVNYAF